MPTPELVTLAEFSRLHGVSRKTASTWKRAGYLDMTADGSVVIEPSNERLSRRARRYRGGAAKDASANVPAEGEVPLTEDEWDTELLREAFRRLLAIGIKRGSVETLCAVCDQILAEWRVRHDTIAVCTAAC